MSSINNDAREFGLHVKQGGWRLGLLVARNVQKLQSGSGGDPGAITPGGKVSARQFAEIAGCGKDRVSRYLDAWNRAATAGHVDPADELSPGQEIDLNWETLPDWGQFYTSVSGGYNGSPERLGKISAEQVAEIIKANPDAALEAMREVRTAQIEQELQLKSEIRNANASDFDDDVQDNLPPVIARPTPAVTPQPTRYLHGYSPVATEIFLIDSQLDDLMQDMQDEGIADADVRNDENYTALNNAYKRIVQNVMALGEALDTIRAKVTAK